MAADPRLKREKEKAAKEKKEKEEAKKKAEEEKAAKEKAEKEKMEAEEAKKKAEEGMMCICCLLVCMGMLFKLNLPSPSISVILIDAKKKDSKVSAMVICTYEVNLIHTICS